MRLVLEIPEVATPENLKHDVSLSIVKSSVEILRLPADGQFVPGAEVGEPVKGRAVIQYVGPLSLSILLDDVKTTKPKRVTKKNSGARAKARAARPGKGRLRPRAKKSARTVRQKE